MKRYSRSVMPTRGRCVPSDKWVTTERASRFHTVTVCDEEE